MRVNATVRMADPIASDPVSSTFSGGRSSQEQVSVRVGCTVLVRGATADVAGAAARTRRVSWLLAGVLLLSLTDLLVTIVHLRSVGMVEANPIAAFLIRSTNSVWVLSAYKLVTVGICLSLLYRLRRHFEAEMAAWCAIAILTGVLCQWYAFSEEIDTPLELRVAQAEFGDDWLRLD